MRITLAFLLLFMLGGLCRAQQQDVGVPYKPMSDATMYRIFFAHVAAFERLASAREQTGLSGAPWRKHLEHKYGITEGEQHAIAAMVLDYDAQVKNWRAQAKPISDAFKQQYFPGGTYPRGLPLPQPPSALATIRQMMDAATLQARTDLHSLLGDSRFAQVDSMVRRSIGGIPVK